MGNDLRNEKGICEMEFGKGIWEGIIGSEKGIYKMGKMYFGIIVWKENLERGFGKGIIVFVSLFG